MCYCENASGVCTWDVLITKWPAWWLRIFVTCMFAFISHELYCTKSTGTSGVLFREVLDKNEIIQHLFRTSSWKNSYWWANKESVKNISAWNNVANWSSQGQLWLLRELCFSCLIRHVHQFLWLRRVPSSMNRTKKNIDEPASNHYETLLPNNLVQEF